jgi:hypothetical protein
MIEKKILKMFVGADISLLKNTLVSHSCFLTLHDPHIILLGVNVDVPNTNSKYYIRVIGKVP